MRWKQFILSALTVLLHGRAVAQDHVPRELSKDEVRGLNEAAPAQATTQPKQPRRLLIFWYTSAYYHQSIPVCSKAIQVLGEKTGAFDADVTGDISVFDPGGLDRYDAVLFNNAVKMKLDDPARRKSLTEFMAAGKGIAGIHAATDNFYTWAEGAEMMGGLFAKHPWRAPGTWAVKVDEPEHPLVKSFGGRGFLVNDEIYQIMGPYSRERSRVLLSLDMSKERNHAVKGIQRTDNDFPISWIHEWGGGRVFYCSLGHNDSVYYRRDVLQHYLDGIQYALGDLEVDARPSALLEPAPQPALCPGEDRQEKP